MKNKFPVIVAVIVGLVSLFAVRQYVDKREQSAKSQLQGRPVLIASSIVKKGTAFSEASIRTEVLPIKGTSDRNVRAAEKAQLVGRKSVTDLQPGQPILWSDVEVNQQSGLGGSIPVGEGAYTIGINRGIKASLLREGDHIDILGSFSVPKPNQPALPSSGSSWRAGSDMVNVVLLQNVTVLWVGDRGLNPMRGDSGSGSEVTLSLTLAEAQLLMFASEHGELGAVLRREGATDIRPREELPRITFDAIEKVVGDLDGKRNVRDIELRRGGKSEKVPVSNINP